MDATDRQSQCTEELKRSDLQGLSPGELIERFKHGQESAFDRLVDATKNNAFARAYHMTGNPDDAFDIVQTCYVKLLKAVKQWDYGCSVQTWLNRVITNACIDLHRRRKTRLVVEDHQVAGACGHDRTDTDENPLYIAMAKDDIMSLQRCIASLPPKMRRCIELRYMDGKSMVEIAAVQGCAEGTVKATVFQGLRKLRRLLSNDPKVTSSAPPLTAQNPE